MDVNGVFLFGQFSVYTIKASFGINHFQVKYFDEDNEEICINSQDEYEEAIKVLRHCWISEGE